MTTRRTHRPSIDERWATLKRVLDKSGLMNHIVINKPLMEKLAESREKLSGQKHPDSGISLTPTEILFYSHFKLAREICSKDFNWFMRNIGKANRILPFHEVKEQFIKYGRDALPDSYKLAERSGAIFKWHPDPTVILIIYARGFGKSTNEANGRPLFDFVNDPQGKALIIHGDKDKVKLLLGGVGLMMQSVGASVLWPEYFSVDKDFFKDSGTKMVAEKINIKMDPEYQSSAISFNDDPMLRREATFTTGSPQIDRTGLHFDRVYGDDLVGDNNSKTKKMQDDLCSYFDSLYGLEEYQDAMFEKRADAPEAHMVARFVGTRWRGPGLYQYIIEKERATVFQLPLTWSEDPAKTYHYHEHRLAPFVTDNFIERKKVELGEWFESQMYMKERAIDGDVSLDFGAASLFAFADDNIQTSLKIPETRKEFTDKNCIIVSKDPSYSIEGKEDRKSSRDTTISVGVSDGKFYLFDEHQQTGGDLNDQKMINTLYEPVRAQFERNDGDVYMQDSYSYQAVLGQIFFEKLRKDFPGRPIFPKKYDKRSPSGTKAKAERAQIILGELFRQGMVRVHMNCLKTIAQLSRVNEGFDLIDCLVQVCSVPAAMYEYLPQRKRAKKLAFAKKSVHNKPRRPKEVLFPTTGY